MVVYSFAYDEDGTIDDEKGACTEVVGKELESAIGLAPGSAEEEFALLVLRVVLVLIVALVSVAGCTEAGIELACACADTVASNGFPRTLSPVSYGVVGDVPRYIGGETHQENEKKNHIHTSSEFNTEHNLENRERD